MVVGETKVFNCIKTVQSIEVNTGIYFIEAYGASGGGSTVGKHTAGSQGGMGGYTKAIINITEPMILYIYVGEAGKYDVTGNPYGGPLGGWNGGGRGGNRSSGSGGGATDIRLQGGAWNNAESLKSRIIVAGAGGGADNAGSTVGGSDDGSGGSGGGLSGQGAWIDGGYHAGYGGTQKSGGGFGYGQDVTNNTDTGGAGSGYWGGKVTNHNNGGAGGGSSYIKGYPGCDTTYHQYQKGIEFIMGVLKQGVHKGNGYVSITYISDEWRKNSNLYKDVYHHEAFDFSKLLEEVL